MSKIKTAVVNSSLFGSPMSQKTIKSTTVCCNFISNGDETHPLSDLSSSKTFINDVVKIDTYQVRKGEEGKLIKDLFQTEIKEALQKYEIGDVMWFEVSKTDEGIQVVKCLCSYENFLTLESDVNKSYWLSACISIEPDDYPLDLVHMIDFDSGFSLHTYFRGVELDSEYDGTFKNLGSFKFLIE